MISVYNKEWSQRKLNENLVYKCSQDNNLIKNNFYNKRSDNMVPSSIG